MASFKIVGIGTSEKYHDTDAYHDITEYIFNSHKSNEKYHGGIAINPKQAELEMETLAYWHGQDKGARLRHMILSFTKWEINDPLRANALAWEIARFYGDRYQIVWSVHQNTEHIHIHFVMNRVSYIDGKKYKGDKKDYYDFQRYMRGILEPLGIDLHIVKDNCE